MKKSFIELEFVVGEDIQQRLQCISLSGNINRSINENFMKLLSEQHFFLIVTPGVGYARPRADEITNRQVLSMPVFVEQISSQVLKSIW